jgi:hypothetical protein
MNGGSRILKKPGKQLDDDRHIFRKRSLLSGNGGLWILIVIIAVITGVAMWLVPEDAPVHAPLPSLDLPADETVSPDVAENDLDADAILPDGARARTIIEEIQTGDAPLGDTAYAKAEEQRSAGRLTDAYLLYFFAARHGNADAALELGTQADPAYYSVGTSNLDAPDAGQAYKWYRMAATAGNAEAERRLAELRNRVELQATAGDAQAQRLMLQWK